jgi:hypothetical protein
MRHLSLLAARLGIAGATGLVLWGCQQSDDTQALDSELGQQFAGLTNSDEQPMFGEEEEFSALGEADADPVEPAAGDGVETAAASLADDARSQAMDDSVPAADRPLVWGLFVSWGRQRFDASATDTTVWNPTLHTDCGALAVRRLVAIERVAGEGVMRPRPDAKTVSFTSSTKPSFDGAFLLLAIRAADASCADTGMLSFTSDALAAPIEIALSDLDGLTFRQPVSDGVNVVILAHRLRPAANDACVYGTLMGHWQSAVGADGQPRGDLGRFRGRVLDEVGDLRGHVRGVWGIAPRGRFAGKRVLFGKFINTEGRFLGLLAGRWEAPDDTGSGHFGGGWHLRPRFLERRGRFMGEYTGAADDDPDSGLFHGRYASEACLWPHADDPLASTDTQ